MLSSCICSRENISANPLSFSSRHSLCQKALSIRRQSVQENASEIGVESENTVSKFPQIHWSLCMKMVFSCATLHPWEPSSVSPHNLDVAKGNLNSLRPICIIFSTNAIWSRWFSLTWCQGTHLSSLSSWVVRDGSTLDICFSASSG